MKKYQKLFKMSDIFLIFASVFYLTLAVLVIFGYRLDAFNQCLSLLIISFLYFMMLKRDQIVRSLFLIADEYSNLFDKILTEATKKDHENHS